MIQKIKNLVYNNKVIFYKDAQIICELSPELIRTRLLSGRTFVLARWKLGEYFEHQRENILSQDWDAWLKDFWPNASNQTVNMYIGFKNSVSFEQAMKMSTHELMNLFIDCFPLSEEEAEL